MVIGEDFGFRNDLEGNTVAIELLLPPWKGIVYRYETVAIKEVDDQAICQFSYEILETNGFIEKKLRKDKRFEKHLGLILNTLILETVEHPEHDRDDNIKEPDQE